MNQLRAYYVERSINTRLAPVPGCWVRAESEEIALRGAAEIISRDIGETLTAEDVEVSYPLRHARRGTSHHRHLLDESASAPIVGEVSQ